MNVFQIQKQNHLLSQQISTGQNLQHLKSKYQLRTIRLVSVKTISKIRTGQFPKPKKIHINSNTESTKSSPSAENSPKSKQKLMDLESRQTFQELIKEEAAKGTRKFSSIMEIFSRFEKLMVSFNKKTQKKNFFQASVFVALGKLLQEEKAYSTHNAVELSISIAFITATRLGLEKSLFLAIAKKVFQKEAIKESQILKSISLKKIKAIYYQS